MGITYLVTGEEMQRADLYTQKHFGVPGLVLMEQAAMAACQCIVRRISAPAKILILVGCGNNGGDGLALVRLLREQGYEVSYTFVNATNTQKPEKLSESAKVNWQILQNYGCFPVSAPWDNSYDSIVDAVFGVGLNRKLEGNIAGLIERANAMKGYKIALDIPSGIDSTLGKVLGTAFQADLTITFGFQKWGLYRYPGISYVGEVELCPIGIGEASFADKKPLIQAFMGVANELLPYRNPNGHKGTFGKVLVVGGSKDIGGAPYFSAKAALLSGCGMVKIFTHEAQREVIGKLLPEAMLGCYSSMDTIEETLLDCINWCDCIVLGPGLGTDAMAQKIWEFVITKSKKPLVLDADGLNLCAEIANFTILQFLQSDSVTHRQLVLTPHPMERKRLWNALEQKNEKEAINEPLKDCFYEEAFILAKSLHAVVVAKDSKTLTVAENGMGYWNLSGNDGMATAGSGDVLTGIIAAFLGQRMALLEAAALGVYVHGLAGDYGAKTYTTYALTADRIAESLTEVFR